MTALHDHPPLRQRPGDSRLADQQFDSRDLAFLATCRFLLALLDSADRHLWHQLNAEVAVLYPGADPDQVVADVMAVLETMRALRRGVFVYADYKCSRCCEYLTQEERYLVSTYRHLRRGQGVEAYTNAFLLCQGEDPAPVVVAMEVLEYRLYVGTAKV